MGIWLTVNLTLISGAFVAAGGNTACSCLGDQVNLCKWKWPPRLVQSVRSMACCHLFYQRSYSCLVLLGGEKRKLGVENEQRNSFSVGSGCASLTGCGESVFLLSDVSDGFTTLLQSIGSPMILFSLIRLHPMPGESFVLAWKSTQRSNIQESLLVSSGSKLQGNGKMGRAVGVCLPVYARGAPSGSGTWSRPEPHVAP